MDSPALFLAFGAVMLVVALLAVAVDWFGKPLRHRRFVPKIYRFPDERQPRHSQVRRTDWSDASLVLPVVERSDVRLVRYPDTNGPGAGLPTPNPYLEPGPAVDGPQPAAPADEVQPVEPDPHLDPVDPDPADSIVDGLVTLEDLESSSVIDPTTPDAQDVADPHQGEPEPGRDAGWQTGQYVLNLTPDGRDPSTTTVRTRYWKNVAATPGAAIFGTDNMERMRQGKAPQRLNHRTSKVEAMRLPSSGWDAEDGATPVPAWPATEIDPFA